MRFLLYNIDNADIDQLLAHFRVARLTEQADPDYRLYFSPWSRGEGRSLRVSMGKRRGGLYAGLHWEAPAVGISGYGAIALTARIMGLTTEGPDLLKVVAKIADVCRIRVAGLTDDEVNGLSDLVDAEKEFRYKPYPDFSAETLLQLGCRVERIYVEHDDSRLPLKDKDGNPVVRVSFGSQFTTSQAHMANFREEDLHRLFGLYELKEYTTRRFRHNGMQVSCRRRSTPFFPILLFAHVQDDKGERGEVWQPEWVGEERGGSESSHFLYHTGADTRPDHFPLVGDRTFTLMVQGGLSAADAIRETGTGEPLNTHRKALVTDENGQTSEEERDLRPEEVRLGNLLLVRNALEAVCAYFHLNTLAESYAYNPSLKESFYHTVWPLQEGDVPAYAYHRLRDYGEKIYLMYECDNRGKRDAFHLCRLHREVRIASLPDRLRERFDVWRGRRMQPSVTIRDFFRTYRLTAEERLGYDGDLARLFLSFLTSSLPVEPLVYKPIIDKKSGTLKDYEYRVDSSCLWQFMACEGYCREVDRDSSDEVGRFIRMEGCFVKELDAKSLLAAVNNKLRDFARCIARPNTEDYRKMCNAIITSRDILEKSAVNLPEMEVDYRSGYGPELDHFFYRNGALRITPHAIEFLSYDQLDFCVDRAEQLPFDFQMPCARGEEPFTIRENPEYRERLEALDSHRRQKDIYTQEQLKREEQELSIWAQTHQWLFDFHDRPYTEWWEPLQVLRCFANEEYDKEEQLERRGQTLSDEQMRMLYGRLANILYALGRPLFRYRGGGTNYMPYITENSVTQEGRSEGGSGKSTFVNTFMACSGKVFKVNARNIRPDNDITLETSNFVPHGHRVVHWEDWGKGLPIDPLYNYVTSGFEYRRRHHDPQRMDLGDSPGHVITSNFQQSYNDPSSSGRVVQTGFSHRFNRGDVRKNLPEQKISDVMPGLRDRPEDMDIHLRSQIAYINALAVQFCMVARQKVLPPMGDLNKRSRIMAMGVKFVEWAEEFFSHPYNFYCPIDFKTIFDEYVELCEASEDKTSKFAPATFRAKIGEYCEDMGYVCLPDVCFSSRTDAAKGYMRVKAWVRKDIFDDEKVWGRGKKKSYRVLEHSDKVMFFAVKTELQEKLPDNKAVKALCRAFYAQPDPCPVIDPETDQPVVISEDDLSRWNKYLLRRQGNYSAQGSTSSGDSAPSAPVEVKPDELPF